MPRRAKRVVKRVVPPDAKYGSVTTAKFINKLMLRGQKATAEHIVYNALELAGQQIDSNPAEVLEQAIRSATPLLRVKARRVGGATYQVPVEVRAGRKNALAIRWIIDYARQRGEKTMRARLAAELMEAANNEGSSIKKKMDTFRMAEANKAFAHYRW